MSELNAAFSINWWEVFFGIIVAVLFFKIVATAVDYIIDKLGLTTKKAIKEKESQQLLEKTNADLQWALETIKDFETKRQEDAENSKKQYEDIMAQLSSLNTKVDAVNEKTTACAEGTVELLRETIDTKCNYYMNTLHGVPTSDVEILQSLKDSYERLNGNHGRQKLLQTCLDLPIIPD